MPVILLALLDTTLRQELKRLFLHQGFEVLEARHETPSDRPLHALIVECGSEDPSHGLDLIRRVRRAHPDAVAFVVAETSSEELAIAALKAGVRDYFKRPLPVNELVQAVGRCLAGHGGILPGEGGGDRLLPGMVGATEPMQRLRGCLRRVADADANVLITGETGTGKELVAQEIHRISRRRTGPFISVNCAAVPDTLLESELFGYERGAFTGAHAACEGKLRLADGGTVFLDEVGDMSPYAQAKILRAIETKEIYPLGGRRPIRLDIRVIAATNRNLESLASEDRFRPDLLFRLNVVRIDLPPLRERQADIPLLLDYFLRDLNRRLGSRVEGLTEEALEQVLRYPWPGNVRELKNLLEGILVHISAGRIRLEDLPARFRDGSPAPPDERERLLSALLATNWNISRAAQKLHWSRMTIYRKLAKYHVVRGPVSQQDRFL